MAAPSGTDHSRHWGIRVVPRQAVEIGTVEWRNQPVQRACRFEGFGIQLNARVGGKIPAAAAACSWCVGRGALSP
jgi:hypothetical protein